MVADREQKNRFQFPAGQGNFISSKSPRRALEPKPAPLK